MAWWKFGRNAFYFNKEVKSQLIKFINVYMGKFRIIIFFFETSTKNTVTTKSFMIMIARYANIWPIVL